MTEPTIGAAWRDVRDRFRGAGIETPDLDARLLAEAAFGLDRLALVLNEQDRVDATGLARLDALARRRLGGEPIARILGHKEFYGLDFTLNAATLVPRPETELLVELALDALRATPEPLLLDLGAGSGCVAIAILASLPRARAIAVDISADALGAAGVNADRLGVRTRLELRQGSWFGAVRPNERFEAIVSNPPYIETGAIAGLARDVREHDPMLALDGGADGLDAYRVIAGAARRHLRANGQLLVEIGSGQGEAVPAILAGMGFSDIAVKKDLAGLDRVVVAHHCDEA